MKLMNVIKCHHHDDSLFAMDRNLLQLHRTLSDLSQMFTKDAILTNLSCQLGLKHIVPQLETGSKPSITGILAFFTKLT